MHRKKLFFYVSCSIMYIGLRVYKRKSMLWNPNNKSLGSLCRKIYPVAEIPGFQHKKG